MRNYICNKKIKGQYARQKRQDTQGVALIIVIFAMLLFAVLGWTLATMQSGDFEVNLRHLDSERALGLAEAGAQWALNQLRQDGGFRTDAGHGYASGYAQHSISPGQYRVVCSDGADAGKVVITSTGYVPTQANPRGVRVVRMAVSFGTIDMSVNARYLFNWSAEHSGSYVNGNIVVTDRSALTISDDFGYEGNGVSPHNQVPADFAVPSVGLCNGRACTRGPPPQGSSFPVINMGYMEQETISENPSRVWAPARAAKITDIQTVAGKSEIVVDQNIFNASPSSQFEGQALRNTTWGHWQNGSWGIIDAGGVLANNKVRLTTVVNWKTGDHVCVVPKIPTSPAPTWNSGSRYYDITVNCNLSSPIALARDDVIRNISNAIRNNRLVIWDYRDWGKVSQNPGFTANSTSFWVQLDSSVPSTNPGWQAGDWLVQVKRFSANTNNQLWYLKGEVIFDTRSGGFNCNASTFIAEGDIGLVGSGAVSLRAHNSRSANLTFPNIATENGNIFSNNHEPSFDGLIYAAGNINETTGNQAAGNIYIQDGVMGVSVYGYNVTFDGICRLNYGADWQGDQQGDWDTSKRISMDAFSLSRPSFSWQEVQ